MSTQQAIHDATKPLHWREKWNRKALIQVGIYFGLCFCAMNALPNTMWDPQIRQVTLIIGTLGVWRYLWWFNHAVRAVIYRRVFYPGLREKADHLWNAGWRPRHIHFMMTTFREHREVTELVVESICRQLREAGCPGTLWLGSGDIFDERIIESHLRLLANDLELEYVMIRQNVPGKRMAIGLVLRAMNRGNIHPDDIIVFMDGDSILGDGCVAKCASLFRADPELQAVTTNEEVVCHGPQWIRSWLTMRFAQRRVAMMSHALSKKVLTLTGRMSVFRAKHLSSRKMIRLVEADHLSHWLWGQFRFLSGDDKSTWYYMLTQNAKMLYVPDALVYTIEYIEGSGLDRMIQNFKRWSGNMLRNGTRALKLGPFKIGWFIWWCVLDQRIAMWTMLVSPILAVMASTLHTPYYIVSYIIWILVSRMALCMVLYCYCRRIDISFPFILYFNQLINAGVKVYCLFRLSKQRWSNRGDQAAGFGDGIVEKLQNAMACYLTTLYLAALGLVIIIYSGLLDAPTLNMFHTFIRG